MFEFPPKIVSFEAWFSLDFITGNSAVEEYVHGWMDMNEVCCCFSLHFFTRKSRSGVMDGALFISSKSHAWVWRRALHMETRLSIDLEWTLFSLVLCFCRCDGIIYESSDDWSIPPCLESRPWAAGDTSITSALAWRSDEIPLLGKVILYQVHTEHPHRQSVHFLFISEPKNWQASKQRRQGGWSVW